MLVIKDNNKEKLVFVHLNKCAGTFAVKLLTTMYINSYSPFSKHQAQGGSKVPESACNCFGDPPSANLKGMLHIPHYELSKIRLRSLMHLKSIPAFGTIRNPWDYYVSLYHFSKEKADASWAVGAIYNRLKQPKTFDIYMKKLFTNTSIKNSKTKTGHAELFQRMDKLNIGVLSARYLNLFFKENIFNYDVKRIKKNYNQLLSINYIIKTENLYPELYNLLTNRGLSHQSLKSLEAFKEFASDSTIKRNKSTHKPYREYYTDELIDLVAKKERLIIDKHNYKF